MSDLADLLVDGAFKLTLNITAPDLADPEFSAFLDESITAAGISASRVGLELTERSTADQQGAIEAIARQKAAGHTVYIDDFGTGYSSLSYLHRLTGGCHQDRPRLHADDRHGGRPRRPSCRKSSRSPGSCNCLVVVERNRDGRAGRLFPHGQGRYPLGRMADRQTGSSRRAADDPCRRCADLLAGLLGDVHVKV
ncbi:MAG: EAL domain-containing protein [Aliidongia sp.]